MTSFAEHARLALHEGRRLAESLMTDTCKVERFGKPVPDGRGGTTRPVTLLYEGKCRAQRPPQSFETTPEAVGREFVVQSAAIHLSVGAFDPRVDDVVTILTSRDDPYLAGRTFRVTAPPPKSLATAYRLGVTEIPPQGA